MAAHPELHPRSNGDRDADRRHLAAKLDLADFGITQFFFEAEPYLRMIDELAALGCTKPVLPGIMPVTNAGSGAALRPAGREPSSRRRWPSGRGHRRRCRGRAALGVEVATELCAQLLAEGAPGLHFYTLNRSTATREIYANLDL